MTHHTRWRASVALHRAWRVLLARVFGYRGSVNVCAWPYRADPTGATDSTAAIQEAINTAAACDAAEVRVGAGWFRVSAPLAPEPR